MAGVFDWWRIVVRDVVVVDGEDHDLPAVDHDHALAGVLDHVHAPSPEAAQSPAVEDVPSPSQQLNHAPDRVQSKLD